MAKASSRTRDVVYRKLKDLSLHTATELVPASPNGLAAQLDAVPLEILPDGRVLLGRDRFEHATKSRITLLPTVIVSVPIEQVEMYVLDRALRSHFLTDDQRAALAVEYAARLSARMRHERAKRAAAVRHGRRASRSPQANKQDARAESCSRFSIAPKKFRQVRRLFNHHSDLYQQVKNNSITLKQAKDAVAREETDAQELHRAHAAPTLSLPDLILGDARTVIPALPNDYFSLLLTDPPYGVNFRQEWRGKAEIAVTGDESLEEAVSLFRSVLIAAGPKMRSSSFLLTFVPAKHEPDFRSVVLEQGWTIISYPIWVKNARVLYPHLNIASQHERMLMAVRGEARLRRPLSDVFRHGKTHASKHPCEKPVALIEKLIDATTVVGEAILDPFAGSGSTIVAANKAGRRGVGIEIEPRWHAEGSHRLRK